MSGLNGLASSVRLPGVGHYCGSLMTFALEAADPGPHGCGCRRLGHRDGVLQNNSDETMTVVLLPCRFRLDLLSCDENYRSMPF